MAKHPTKQRKQKRSKKGKIERIEEEGHHNQWEGYIKCDDLVPPSCDDTLEVTKGQVETLEGVFVTYWKYSNNKANFVADDDDDDHDDEPTTTKNTSLPNNKSKKNKNNKKYPIIVINGGPGLPHNYIKPARSLACAGGGRDVVMYDQAGTGESWIEDVNVDRPFNENDDDVVGSGGGDDDDDIEDADPSQIPLIFPELLTMNYYAHIELPAILDALGWRNSGGEGDEDGGEVGGYHILAESWGTQIAFEYAAHSHPDKPPDGLKSLSMNAPISDNHKFIEYQWDRTDGSVGTLPTYIQDRLKYFNSTNDFDNEEFETLEEVVMGEFNARIGVVVDCWLETEQAGISTIDYDQLTGRTDIFPASPGVDLRGWTVLPDLWKLPDFNIAVQLNHGRFDMVRPHLIADTAAALGYNNNNNNNSGAGRTPRGSRNNLVECHMLERAAHSILLDSPLEAYSCIKDFFDRVEGFDGATDDDRNDDTEYGRTRFQTVGSCPVPADFERNIITNSNEDNGSPASSSLLSSSQTKSSLPSSSQSKSLDRKSQRHNHRWRYENGDDCGGGGAFHCRNEFTAGWIEWLLSLVVTMILAFMIGKKVGARGRHDPKIVYRNKSTSSLSCWGTNTARDDRYQTIPEISMDSDS